MAPLAGLFVIESDNSGWFSCRKLNGLCLADKNYKYDVILTESRDGRGENELIKNWRSGLEIIGAKGNSLLAKRIEIILSRRSGCRMLVLADLFNVGQQFASLADLQKRYPDRIRFYDYGCFEEMLFNSNFTL